MAIMIKVLYGDVVLVSTRGRRSLFIFLIDIYLQSLPGCLLILFFFFSSLLSGCLMVTGQVNGSVNQVITFKVLVSFYLRGKPGAAHDTLGSDINPRNTKWLASFLGRGQQGASGHLPPAWRLGQNNRQRLVRSAPQPLYKLHLPQCRATGCGIPCCLLYTTRYQQITPCKLLEHVLLGNPCAGNFLWANSGIFYY